MTLGLLCPLGCFLGFEIGCSAKKGNALNEIASGLNPGVAAHPNHQGAAGLFPKINIHIHQQPADQNGFQLGHYPGCQSHLATAPSQHGQARPVGGNFGQPWHERMLGQPEHGGLLNSNPQMEPITGVEPQHSSGQIPHVGLKELLENHKMIDIDRKDLPEDDVFVDGAAFSQALPHISRQLEILRNAKDQGISSEELGEAANFVREKGLDYLERIPWHNKEFNQFKQGLTDRLLNGVDDVLKPSNA